MVDNIDDSLALRILTDFCKGISIEGNPLQLCLDFASVDGSMRSGWDRAAHGKINLDILNEFLQGVKYGKRLIEQDVSNYIHSDEDVLTGEMLLLRFADGSERTFMKMYRNEYLTLDNAKFEKTTTSPDSWITSSESVRGVFVLQPSLLFRILDKIWIQNLAGNTVTDNVWPLFNSVRKYVDNQSLNESWRKLFCEFSEHGLGMSHLYMLTNTAFKQQMI